MAATDYNNLSSDLIWECVRTSPSICPKNESAKGQAGIGTNADANT